MNEAQDERWIPKEGEAYWTVDFDGKVTFYINEGTDEDSGAVEFGSAFRTQRLAALAAERISEALSKLHDEIGE